jgi:hypothetical protein
MPLHPSRYIDIFYNPEAIVEDAVVARALGATRPREGVIPLEENAFRLIMAVLTTVSVAVAIAALYRNR